MEYTFTTYQDRQAAERITKEPATGDIAQGYPISVSAESKHVHWKDEEFINQQVIFARGRRNRCRFCRMCYRQTRRRYGRGPVSRLYRLIFPKRTAACDAEYDNWWGSTHIGRTMPLPHH